MTERSVHYLSASDLWHGDGHTACGRFLDQGPSDRWFERGAQSGGPVEVTMCRSEITCSVCAAKCHLPRKD